MPAPIDPLDTDATLDPLLVAALADPEDAPYGECSYEKSTLARVRLSAVLAAARAVVASASRDRSDFTVRVGRPAFDRLAYALAAADATS